MILEPEETYFHLNSSGKISANSAVKKNSQLSNSENNNDNRLKYGHDDKLESVVENMMHRIFWEWIRGWYVGIE